MSDKELPEFSSAARSLRTGRYRHFKKEDHEYEVLGVARHSETLEEMVVYKALYGAQDIWVRPLDNFLAVVDTPEGPRSRFIPIGDMEDKGSAAGFELSG